MPIRYNRLPTIAAGASAKVGAALAKTAFDTEAAAKVLVPRDTGALANSIGAEQLGPLSWRVNAAAEYAIYVEVGTYKMNAQPYLDPALRQTWPSLLHALGTIV
tara:strand:- start:1459 stop:1770 length:312 start_codon:yes stop_codon:yes gene_type:complete